MPIDVATLGINVVSDSVATADQRLAALGNTAGRVSSSIQSLLAIVGVTLGFRELIQAVSQNEVALGQMEIRLRTTGAALNYTGQQMREMATNVSRLSAYNDTNVISAEAVLLRYNRIGRDVFPLALQASADLGRAMGVDLTTAAFHLGRAMQDPITGLQMLRREGISFDEALVKQIQTAFRHGDVLKYQTLLLNQVGVASKGAAEAYRNTLAGSIDSVRNAFDELLERMGERGFSSAMRQAADRMAEFIRTDEAGVNALADLTSAGVRFASDTLGWLGEILRWLEEHPNVAALLGLGGGAAMAYAGHPIIGGAVAVAGARTLAKEGMLDLSDPAQFAKAMETIFPSLAPGAPPPGSAAIGYGLPTGGVPVMKSSYFGAAGGFYTSVAGPGGLGVSDEATLQKVKAMQAQAAVQTQLTALIIATNAAERDNVVATTDAGRAITYAAEAEKLKVEIGDKLNKTDLAAALAAQRTSLVQKDLAADYLAMGKAITATHSPMEQLNDKLKDLNTTFRNGQRDPEGYARVLRFTVGQALIQVTADVRAAGDALEQAQLGRSLALTGGTTSVAGQRAATELEYQQKIAKEIYEFNALYSQQEQALNPVLAEQLRQRILNLNAERQLVEQTNLELKAAQVIAETATPEQQLANKYNDLVELVAAGKLSADEATKAARTYREQIMQTTTETDRLKQATVDAFDVIHSAFGKAMQSGDFKNAIGGAFKDIQKMVEQTFVEEPFQEWLKGGLRKWKSGDTFMEAFFTNKEPAMPNFGAVPVAKDFSNITTTNGAMNVYVTNGGGGPGMPSMGGDLFSGLMNMGQGGPGNTSTEIVNAYTEAIGQGTMPILQDAFMTGSETAATNIAGAFSSQAGGGGFVSMLTGALSGIGSFFMGLFGFEHGGIVGFERGGLITRPTIFPMAKGLGLAGESGIEAIMPLHRGPSGDLGVRASTAGERQQHVAINVYNNTGEQVKTRERKTSQGREVDIMIGEMIANDIRRGGQVWKALETQAGLKRNPAMR